MQFLQFCEVVKLYSGVGGGGAGGASALPNVLICWKSVQNPQACPWEWDFCGNPMGNVPWDGMGQNTFVFSMRLRN